MLPPLQQKRQRNASAAINRKPWAKQCPPVHKPPLHCQVNSHLPQPSPNRKQEKQRNIKEKSVPLPMLPSFANRLLLLILHTPVPLCKTFFVSFPQSSPLMQKPCKIQHFKLAWLKNLKMVLFTMPFLCIICFTGLTVPHQKWVKPMRTTHWLFGQT